MNLWFNPASINVRNTRRGSIFVRLLVSSNSLDGPGGGHFPWQLVTVKLDSYCIPLRIPRSGNFRCKEPLSGCINNMSQLYIQ